MTASEKTIRNTIHYSNIFDSMDELHGPIQEKSVNRGKENGVSL